MLTNTNLFGLTDIINQPNRTQDGKFAPKCDGEPQANVKRHLELGMSITVLQCIRLYGSTECKRIICRLRKSGMNIGDTWFIENGRKRYKIYKLSKEVKK